MPSSLSGASRGRGSSGAALQPVRQVGVRPGLAGRPRAGDHDGEVLEALGEVEQELERGAIRPLEVVDRDQRRIRSPASRRTRRSMPLSRRRRVTGPPFPLPAVGRAGEHAGRRRRPWRATRRAPAGRPGSGAARAAGGPRRTRKPTSSSPPRARSTSAPSSRASAAAARASRRDLPMPAGALEHQEQGAVCRRPRRGPSRRGPSSDSRSII